MDKVLVNLDKIHLPCFDAAADADANADADAPALTLSIRSPHVWVKAIEMGAKGWGATLISTPSAHKANAKPTKGLTSNEQFETVCVFIYWPIHAISDPKTSENLMVMGTWPEPSRHVPHVFL